MSVSFLGLAPFAGETPLLSHGHTAAWVGLSVGLLHLSAHFNFMFRSLSLEKLMTCKLLSNVKLEIECKTDS